MPIYDFKCLDCKNSWEDLVEYSQSEEVKCPRCGGVNVKKIFSAPSLVKAVHSRKTCCGSSSPCETPPCLERGTCRKNE